MEREEPERRQVPHPSRWHRYAKSPFTRHSALLEPLDRPEATAEWFLVRETDGAVYFASSDFLARCEKYPLLPGIAREAHARATAFNDAGEIPAFVTEVEAMFVSLQKHRWAAQDQVYCAVSDKEGS